MKKLLALAISTAVLAGCGGGGDGPAPVVQYPDEGYWGGVSSNGWTVNALILENGEAWGLYSSGSTIYGVLKGKSGSSGTNFVLNGKQFDFLNNQIYSGVLSGTVTPKTSIQATSNVSPINVTLAYSASYDQPASLSDLAGTYNLSARTAQYTGITATTVIGQDGRFSIVDGGCTTSGAFTPRATGKNVFNVQVTSTGTCVVGNVTFNGVAVYIPNAGSPYFIALTTNNTDTDGFLVVGSKAIP